MNISVIIPTHNPRHGILARTLDALQKQTLPRTDWELLVIDNRSNPPLPTDLVAWHPRGRVVREETLGLTPARFRGIRVTRGDLLVWCDDDNLLAPDYLEVSRRHFAIDARLGAAGGRSLPEYESPRPAWYDPSLAPLGCRDLGSTRLEAQWSEDTPRTYPACAPIGAGLVTRREAISAWAEIAQTDPRRARLGRTGIALTSGEDNDISLTLLSNGWSLAYLPDLSLTHLIPATRLTADYQARIARATYRDFVRVLTLHGVCPWPPVAAWTLPFLKMKAWVTFRAWRGVEARIRWQGACGQFEGRVKQPLS